MALSAVLCEQRREHPSASRAARPVCIACAAFNSDATSPKTQAAADGQAAAGYAEPAFSQNQESVHQKTNSTSCPHRMQSSDAQHHCFIEVRVPTGSQ
jgi:hypothetical protein